MYQGLSFAQDLKLGHYMHVPPMMMFSVQVLATIWGGLVNVGVLFWVSSPEMKLIITGL